MKKTKRAVRVLIRSLDLIMVIRYLSAVLREDSVRHTPSTMEQSMPLSRAHHYPHNPLLGSIILVPQFQNQLEFSRLFSLAISPILSRFLTKNEEPGRVASELKAAFLSFTRVLFTAPKCDLITSVLRTPRTYRGDRNEVRG